MELIQNQALRWQFVAIIIISVTMQFCGISSFMMIENTGKTVLLFRGHMTLFATLILLTITLHLQSWVSWMPNCRMVLIFFFIFFFAGGLAGASEMLAQSFKSAGNTLGCTLNWISMFFLGVLFPFIGETMHYFCFLIFLFVCAACGLYVKSNVPETKNLTALEIAAVSEDAL